MKQFSICLIFLAILSTCEQKIQVTDAIELIPLGDSVYVHKTWENWPNAGRFSSNGLIVVKKGKAVMIDTPFDNAKTENIYNYLLNDMNVRIEKHIAGHFHNDCIGGLEFLHRKGVQSIASNLTIEKCMEEELEVPDIGFDTEYDLDFYGKKLECRFYGGAHSFDNIVVYIPDNKILFGGCMVRSITAVNLGNLTDAVVDEWDTTLEKVMTTYSSPKVIIPGHGRIGGKESIKRTIELVRRKK